MRLRLIGSFVCLMMLMLSSTAQGWVSKFKITPSKPYVDEPVTVSWHTDRKLKPGYYYEGSLSASASERGCTKLAVTSSKRRPKKGSNMSLTFTTEDAFVSYPEWCDGHASIAIYEVNGPELQNGNIVGIASFRFYRKP